jgi:hypothetical protein
MIKESILGFIRKMHIKYHSCFGSYEVVKKYLWSGPLTTTTYCFRDVRCTICGKEKSFAKDLGYGECHIPLDDDDWGVSQILTRRKGVHGGY